MSTRLDTSPRTRARLARLALFDGNGPAVDKTDRLDNQDRPAPEATPPQDVAPARAFLPTPARARIDKCVKKLKSRAKSVDILHASLSKVLDNPTVERFRKVNVSQGIFKKEVADVPGGTELMFAVGYESWAGHLLLQDHNAALLSYALSELARARETDEYRQAKAKVTAEVNLAQAASLKAAEEQALRAAALAKVPPEPSAGDADSACQITISLTSGERLARRHFSSENTLGDLANFVRSLPAVPTTASFRLENVTTRPPRVMDLALHHACSLYALDLWPIGRVTVSCLEDGMAVA